MARVAQMQASGEAPGGQSVTMDRAWERVTSSGPASHWRFGRHGSFGVVALGITKETEADKSGLLGRARQPPPAE